MKNIRSMPKSFFVLWTLIFSGAIAQAQGIARPAIPRQSHIINLSVLEALVAIKESELAGIFGFIPEDSAAMAMADYLLHNPRALKRFIKKGEKDLKTTQGINEWDKQVFLFLVGISSSGNLPPGIKKISARAMNRISSLSLAQPLPLQIMVQRRAANN